MNLTIRQQLVAQRESGDARTQAVNRGAASGGRDVVRVLNGEGGRVLIGVGPDGKIIGQQVSDNTLRDIAAILGRFEPPARIDMDRVDVGNERTAIVLDAPSAREHAPFIFEGKPYRRVGSTTTVMAQEEYARLLLDRNHSRHRLENRPAVGIRLEDLDHEEILRTRQTAIEQRRPSVEQAWMAPLSSTASGYASMGRLRKPRRRHEVLARLSTGLLELGR